MSQFGPRESDRRRRERFKTQAPLIATIGARKIPAFTRDLSNKGAYFYLAVADSPEVGQDIEFVIELPPDVTLSDRCRIRCRGHVVRVENTSWGEAGVGVEIIDYAIQHEETVNPQDSGAGS